VAVHLLAVGARLPGWAAAGVEDYARRLPRGWLRLTEVPAARRRGGQSAADAVHREGERLLARVPAQARVVALDERGRSLTTAELGRRLERWLGGGSEVALLMGGPDGLARACLARADERWSLSALTLPHALVRVLVVEQLYRVWSAGRGHPYHRA